LDLRKRLVEAVETGATCHAAAQRFAVSVSCVVKLLQLWREKGSLEPRQIGGYRPLALAPHEELVRALVKAQPDLTLPELCAVLAREGIQVGRSSVWRFLEARAITLKKSRSGPPSRTGRTSRPPAQRGAPVSRR
jgi:putative transposase